MNLGAAIAAVVSVRTATAQRTGCPEWQEPGVRAALIATQGSPGSVLAAAALAAEDPSLQAPSERAFVTHWPKNAKDAPMRSHNVPCPDHPTEHDLPCPEPAEPISPERIAELKAEALAAIAANPYRPHMPGQPKEDQ